MSEQDSGAGRRGGPTTWRHYGAVPYRVLVADDDRAIRESLLRALELEGYEVVVVSDGVDALATARRERFDVLILDVMMPSVDGLGVCRVLRADGDGTPILMLTARVETSDRVAGLDAGADDYLPKPFDVAEFRARVRALTRRGVDQVESIPIGAGRLEIAQRTVCLPDGGEVQLTAREFELIRSLASRPRWVHSRRQLRQQVFPEAHSETIVDTYVHYLRRKIGPGAVRTVHGLGYRIGSL